MSGLTALAGAFLEGVRVDVPYHRVMLTLRTSDQKGRVEHVLVLEGVTDFSFFDEYPEPWDHAVVSQIGADHDADSLRVEVSFGSDAAGLAITCAKLILRKARL